MQASCVRQCRRSTAPVQLEARSRVRRRCHRSRPVHVAAGWSGSPPAGRCTAACLSRDTALAVLATAADSVAAARPLAACYGGTATPVEP